MRARTSGGGVKHSADGVRSGSVVAAAVGLAVAWGVGVAAPVQAETIKTRTTAMAARPLRPRDRCRRTSILMLLLAMNARHRRAWATTDPCPPRRPFARLTIERLFC